MARRKFRSAEDAKRFRDNEKSWSEICQRHGVTKKPLPKKVLSTKTPLYDLQKSLGRVPIRTSVQEGVSPLIGVKRVQYEGEMLERELKAQKLIHEKANRVAPLGNKMGYGYFTDDMVKDMKSGSLRRRG